MQPRQILPALSCSLLLGCGFEEIFRSPKGGAVVLTYTGRTNLKVSDRIPVPVAVEVGGASVLNPRLSVTSSDTSIIALSPQSDTLIARSRGQVTLTIKLVASICTDSCPTILQEVRVTP